MTLLLPFRPAQQLFWCASQFWWFGCGKRTLKVGLPAQRTLAPIASLCWTTQRDLQCYAWSSVISVSVKYSYRFLSLRCCRLHTATDVLNNPLFALVSGLCSQSPPTFKRVCDLITHLALPAGLHMIFFKPVVFHSIVNPSRLHEYVLDFIRLRTINSLWHLDYWKHCWYLFALLFWRLLSFTCFARLNSCSVMILGSLITCIGAYGLAGQTLVASSAIGCLPYFTCGYLLDRRIVLNAASGVSALPVGLRFAAVTGCMLLLNIEYLPAFRLDDHSAYCDWCVTKYDYGMFLMQRVMHDVVTVSICLLMLLFVVPRSKTWLSQVGRFSLYVYLHHKIVLEPIQHLPAFSNDSNNAWLSSSIHGLLVAAMCGYCISVAAALLITSKPWRWLWSWAVEPTWADALTRSCNFESTLESRTCSAAISGPAPPQHAGDKDDSCTRTLNFANPPESDPPESVVSTCSAPPVHA